MANVPHSQIGPIAVHFPERVETNEQLQAENPDWDVALIAEKTGISLPVSRPNARRARVERRTDGRAD